MIKGFTDWKREQQRKLKEENRSFEFIYETSSTYVVVFDIEGKGVHYEISKEDIKSRQDMLDKLIEMSKLKWWHNVIAREFIKKAERNFILREKHD